MNDLYDNLLDAWAEKKKIIRRNRALYVSRQDADYLRYAHEAEEEMKESRMRLMLMK